MDSVEKCIAIGFFVFFGGLFASAAYGDHLNNKVISEAIAAKADAVTICMLKK